LPEPERKAWEQFWSEVDSRLRQLDDIKVYRGAGHVVFRADPSPADPEEQHSLGIDLLRVNKLDEAVAAFKEAIRLKPDYADAHNALGVALSRQDKLVEAEAAYREAIRHLPDATASSLGKATMLESQR